MERIQAATLWANRQASAQSLRQSAHAHCDADLSELRDADFFQRTTDRLIQPAACVLRHTRWTQVTPLPATTAAGVSALDAPIDVRGAGRAAMRTLGALVCMAGAALGAALRFLLVVNLVMFVGFPWALGLTFIAAVRNSFDKVSLDVQAIAEGFTGFFGCGNDEGQQAARAQALWEVYLDSMSRPYTWGTNVEIRAAAQIWGRDFSYVNVMVSKKSELTLQTVAQPITREWGEQDSPYYLAVYSRAHGFTGKNETYHYDALIGEGAELDSVKWDEEELIRYRHIAPSDGACLFSSIGMLVGQSPAEVRRTIVAWLREHGMTHISEMNEFTPAQEASFGPQ